MSQLHAPNDNPILAAWRAQLTRARANPFLFQLLLKQWQRILKRLAYFYAQLASLPRRQRRALQRALATSLIGAAMLLALSSAPIVHAATISVDGATCTLDDAIKSANTNTAVGGCTSGAAGSDTLDLTANILLSASPSPVTSEIILDGNGFYIDGNAANRILYVSTGGDLTINNVTLQNGSALWGGALYNYQGTVAINDSTLTGNDASGNGGAIDIFGVNAQLTLTNCTVSGNTAVGNGGGIANYYGSVKIYNSVITGNDGAEGGGVHTYQGYVRIENTTLSYNDAVGEDGGALRSDNGGVVLVGSTVNGNTAVDDGGGLDNRGGGQMTVLNSTISGNHAGSGASNDGGGFRNVTDGKAYFYNVSIVNNTAGNVGGGIAHNSVSIDGGALVELHRTLVSGNRASVSANEVYGNTFYATNADDYNLFGDSGETSAQAFTDFTPGATDLNATSDGLNALLTDILNTTLANNGSAITTPGGVVQTLALVLGSPALDKAPNADCTAAPINDIDQRGFPRNVDFVPPPTANDCDIGAFELQNATAVNVTGLRAKINERGNVALKWRTTSESQIAGFNVYRRNGQGEWKQINANFKQAKHAGTAQGDKYRYVDKKVQDGNVYRYKIEVKYLDGHTEFTEAVKVTTP